MLSTAACFITNPRRILKKFLFADLDDTLFQTIQKCRPSSDLRPAAYLKDGVVCSFTTKSQRSLLDWMTNGATLIPTTARNKDALDRVCIPFSSYSIIDYGGIVLEPGGAVDQEWLDLMHADMSLAQGGLTEIRDAIGDWIGCHHLPCRVRLIEDFGLPFYVVVKDSEGQPERLRSIEELVVGPWLKSGLGSGFVAYRNANNLAILPPSLNKARAVIHVCERLRLEHGEIMTAGMGDSLSDAKFLAFCDYAILPRNSQLSAFTIAAL